MSDDEALSLSLRLDQIIKAVRPDDWRGNPAKQNAIKEALYAQLRDAEQVERIFPIISAYREY